MLKPKNTRTIFCLSALGLLVAAFCCSLNPSADGQGSSLSLKTARGITYVESSSAPGVVVGTLGRDGGTLVAKTAKSLLELSDRYISVKNFGAVGDGTTNDDAAIQSALTYIKATGYSGKLYFPAGTYKYTTTIALANDYMQMAGDGILRTTLDFRGTGPAVYVTAAQRVRIADIKVRTESAATNGTTHGIQISYVGATTGFDYTLERVEAVGFDQGNGFYLTNCEHTHATQCQAYGCLHGFVLNNATHTGGALGINNVFIACRAHESLDDGWDIGAQSSCQLNACQSFSVITPTHAHVYVHSSSSNYPSGPTTYGCSACLFLGLDVENHNATPQLGTGLQISGTQHTVQVNGFSLAQGIRCSTCTTSFFLAQKISSSAAGLLFDSGSSTNRFVDTGYQITDQGNGNRPSSGGTYRAVTGATTALSSDRVIDCTANSFTVTLPAASRLIGPVTIYNNGAGTITISGTVSGVSSPTLAAGKYMTVAATGSTYLNIGSN